jgi:hypothetical protein
MIWDVYPGSRIPILDPGSRGKKGTGSGSATLMIRKMCAAEEEQLLDSVMDCGHGNWSDIGNTNQGHYLRMQIDQFFKKLGSGPVATF